MTVNAINDLIKTDGLVPILLVFGALQRLGLLKNSFSPSTFQRAIALRKATSEMSKHFAARQVRDALNSRDGPNETNIHNTPLGAPTLVYRPEQTSGMASSNSLMSKEKMQLYVPEKVLEHFEVQWQKGTSVKRILPELTNKSVSHRTQPFSFQPHIYNALITLRISGLKRITANAFENLCWLSSTDSRIGKYLPQQPRRLQKVLEFANLASLTGLKMKANQALLTYLGQSYKLTTTQIVVC